MEKTTIARDKTVYGTLQGAKISFISYPFFVPKQPLRQYGAVRVLSLPDIAVMKIIAISQRGRKRDFVDLYWYLTHQGSLLQLMHCLPEQYPTVAHDYHHILKSMLYFDDADGEPMPELYFKANWKTIKNCLRREVKTAAKELLKF